MKNLDNISINTSKLKLLQNAIIQHEGDNPACKRTKYRVEEIRLLNKIEKTKKLPAELLGDAWPYVSNSENYESKATFCHYNQIMKQITFLNKGDIIVEIGAGYGRLAITFLSMQDEDLINYVGIDYSVIGLLTAPQIISQLVIDSVRPWYIDEQLDNYRFISLPAWNIDELRQYKDRIRAFIAIDSFKKMHKETINFYLRFIRETGNKAVCYMNTNC